MSILTLDFETFYDKDYSLSKLTIEEYIQDERFEVIGYSIKCDTAPVVWVSGTKQELQKSLCAYEWSTSILITHNALFDATILAWYFGITPAFYADTLCMARALNGPDTSASLANLTRMYHLGTKGDEVYQAVGKRLKDFTSTELVRYGDYCKTDTELTYSLFKTLASDFPASEMELVDQTVRMFVSPTLELDVPVLQARLKEIKLEKSKLLSDLMIKLECKTEEEVRVKLASNPKFAEVLEDYGITPPLKANKDGKLITAFAKTDLGFIALEEHPDPFIQQLCAARLGTKSTIEEARINRFIEVGQRNKGLLPVPLKYYAAHPGRWGGMDAINLQNLPERDQKKRTLKASIRAPTGYALLAADLSQIEARILAWLAGQEDVLEQFRKGEDVYCYDATLAFGRTITKADIKERFIGKTMRLGLGYGTGAAKLTMTLKQGGAEINYNECAILVQSWRRNNQRITKLWDHGNYLLKQLMAWPPDGNTFYFGEHEILPVTPYGISLPNSLYLRYSNLRENKGQMIHDSRKGPLPIWGGVVTENVVQALARIVMTDAMIKIRPQFPIALTVHDALLMVVRKAQLDEAKAFVEDTMITPPPWALNLPIAVKIKHGDTYAECS